MSTDYVFDGTKPPYKIDDEPNPLNKYAETKLAGERATLEIDEGKGTKIRILYIILNKNLIITFKLGHLTFDIQTKLLKVHMILQKLTYFLIISKSVKNIRYFEF